MICILKTHQTHTNSIFIKLIKFILAVSIKRLTNFVHLELDQTTCHLSLNLNLHYLNAYSGHRIKEPQLLQLTVHSRNASTCSAATQVATQVDLMFNYRYKIGNPRIRTGHAIPAATSQSKWSASLQRSPPIDIALSNSSLMRYSLRKFLRSQNLLDDMSRKRIPWLRGKYNVQTARLPKQISFNITQTQQWYKTQKF
ncbi:Hypothetical_protein [Hexamita inflata]|uniref:Hypothetical_protein n=1 Tax=Hexamita inflata TaxID=28002 RepID=A0AA86TX14_9EUKA|nr:Hypothetical protein HINF_LOCUS20190 [Hexamita inflata]